MTDLTRVLPHRPPFLAIDRVIEILPGKRAVAAKDVTAGSFWSGKGDSYPQVLILEAMAQVGALAAAGPGNDSGGGELMPGYLAALSDTKFGRMPQAGDTVVFTMEFEAGMGGLVRFKGTARIADEMAAESVMTFSVPVRK